MNEYKKEIQTREFKKIITKQRVCAYARVSTASEMQMGSFDTQVETYTNKIVNNPDWKFVGVFADKGKSGTSLKKRNQFNMMIELARNNSIDLILTKSISRFARNTIDCLKLIQELKTINVEIFFEKENVSSFDPKIEFIISILSGMAEEESRSISDNVKWGFTKRFENGEFHIVTKRMLGYDRDKSNKLIINQEQAKVIKKIYSMYIEGHGATSIVTYLETNHIKTTLGKTHWSKTGIFGILSNEKYTGDALLQKTYRPSFKSKKKVKNNGVLPQFYVVDSHPAIISKKDFNIVQEIRKLKSIKYHKSNFKNLSETYSKNSPYTHFVKCPYCGKFFHLRSRKSSDGTIKRFLQCASNTSKKTCISEPMPCELIDEAIVNKVNSIIKNKKLFLDDLEKALYSNPAYLDLTQRLGTDECNLIKLIDKRKSIAINNIDFNKSVVKELDYQITKLKVEIAKSKSILATKYNVKAIVQSKKVLLKKYNKSIESINDFPYKDFFSYTIVYNEEKIDFFSFTPYCIYQKTKYH
jgi:DNA invertase Pin-like site-specific DNA recombinase